MEPSPFWTAQVWTRRRRFLHMTRRYGWVVRFWSFLKQSSAANAQRCTWTNIKVQKVNRCRRAAKQILSNYISLSYGSYLVILQSRFANNTQKFFFQKRRQMTLWLIDRLTPHKNTNWRVLMRYYELKLFWGSILILLQLHFDEIFMSKS